MMQGQKEERQCVATRINRRHGKATDSELCTQTLQSARPCHCPTHHEIKNEVKEGVILQCEVQLKNESRVELCQHLSLQQNVPDASHMQRSLLMDTLNRVQLKLKQKTAETRTEEKREEQAR